MKKNDLLLLMFRIPLDFLSIIVAWSIAYIIRPYTDLIPGVQIVFPVGSLPLMSFFIPFVLCSAGAFVLLMALLGRYQFTEKFEPVKEFFQLLFALVLWAMVLIAWYALARHELIFSRVMLAHTIIFALGCSVLGRSVLRAWQVRGWKNKKNKKGILLFGTEEETKKIQAILQFYPQFQVVRTIHHLEVSEQVFENSSAEELWRCSSDVSADISLKLQEFCDTHNLYFRFVPHEDTLSFARLELNLFGGVPIISALPCAPTYWQRVGKRTFDIVASCLGLLVLTPAFLLFAIFIKMDSAGSVFYRSTRIGRYKKPFQMWKFRSMVADAEKKKTELIHKSHRDDGPLFKVKNDPRVTKFGKFLRNTSFDELPNLMNVIRGDMSLVGPRPHLPEEVEQYEQWQKRVLMMKPGITGLAQISGRSDLSFDEEVQYDLYYLKNWSFWLDIKIIFRTIFVILSQKGAD